MGYFVVILLAYVLGSSNMAFYISKIRQVNMRDSGSGNLGTSNAVILMGWRAGVLVGIHDIGKGILAVFLAGALFPQLEYAKAVAGVACVLGHIFPFYLKFKGGKGFAPFVGMTAMLNWKLALVVVLLVAVITLVTDYLVLGTFTSVVLVPVWMGFSAGNYVTPLVLLVATAAIFYKHWENILRLLNGTEIGLRSTASGKHRVK